MAAPIKEIEVPIGILPVVSDSPISIFTSEINKFMEEPSFNENKNQPRTNSLFTDNLAVVTDFKEEIDTINRPSCDDVLILETEEPIRVTIIPLGNTEKSPSEIIHKLPPSDKELNNGKEPPNENFE